MQTLVERGCGLDVHQATVVACLLIVLKNKQVQKQARTFGTTTRELLSLREWLLSQGCTHVAMESTGVYWKPIYAVLEGAFEIVVANAQHIKKVPGRKTDVLCCAPDYVADESDSRTWAGTESRRTKHKQIADKRKEKPRDDNVDMQNCSTLLQGLTVGIRNLAEYAKALSIKLIHSSRSRIAGSIDSARCAGIQVATRPSNVIARTTPVNTRGSRGVA
jgi:Transposase